MVNPWVAETLMIVGAIQTRPMIVNRQPNPIELLLPDGNATTSFVLGGNCPESLLPETSTPADQNIDLFMLAPTASECRTAGWLESAAARVDQHLSRDGVCYLLVPPYWRLKTIRLLIRQNLSVDSSFWHFPDWTSTHYLIPLQPGPALFAVNNVLPAPSWKKIAAQTIFRHAETYQLLRAFWNPIGISVRRPGARPLFQWLSAETDRTAIIRKSWRTSQGADILYSFQESDRQPSAIVKTASARNSSVCLDCEAEILDSVRESIRDSGVRVPKVLRRQQTAERSTLFLSPVPGVSAADLLASQPDQLLPLLSRIVAWLERWHIATKRMRSLDARQLEQESFNSIEELAPSLQNVDQYRKWLSKRAQAASNTAVPLVATHNDLTMANVLVDDRLGVVDWETGMEEGWPLVDFYYAVTDAVRIAQAYPTWLEAFKDCYQPGGAYTEHVNAWEQQLRSSIGMSSDFSELCFHFCWLHHASNEQRVSQPHDARPFLQIVQWLSLNCAGSPEHGI